MGRQVNKQYWYTAVHHNGKFFCILYEGTVEVDRIPASSFAEAKKVGKQYEEENEQNADNDT